MLGHVPEVQLEMMISYKGKTKVQASRKQQTIHSALLIFGGRRTAFLTLSLKSGCLWMFARAGSRQLRRVSRASAKRGRSELGTAAGRTGEGAMWVK